MGLLFEQLLDQLEEYYIYKIFEIRQDNLRIPIKLNKLFNIKESANALKLDKVEMIADNAIDRLLEE